MSIRDTQSRPLIMRPTARYWATEYRLLSTVTESITTKTMHSIFMIWYELAEIRVRPVKFRNEPIASSRAGAAKVSGLMRFFWC